MANIELKRTQLELIRVRAAKAEMEFVIAEKLEDIERVKNNIKIQEAREAELIKKLAETKEVI